MIPVVVRCRPPRTDSTRPQSRAPRHEAPTTPMRVGPDRRIRIPAWAHTGGGALLAPVVLTAALAVALLVGLTVYAVWAAL